MIGPVEYMVGDHAAFAELTGEVGSFIGAEDIEHAAALRPSSCAALLIWEDTGANEFVPAMRNSGGGLVEGGRIPDDLVEDALSAISGAS